MSANPIISKTTRTVKGIECEIIRNDPAHPEYQEPTNIHVSVGKVIFATVRHYHILSEDRWNTQINVHNHILRNYMDYLHCMVALELATDLAGEFDDTLKPQADALTPEPAAAVPTTLTNDEFEQLDLMLSCDLNIARVQNNTPDKYQMMLDLESRGLVFRYTKPFPSWTISDEGRSAVRAHEAEPQPEHLANHQIAADSSAVPNSIDQLPPAIQAEIRDLDKQLDDLSVDDPEFFDKLKPISDRKAEIRETYAKSAAPKVEPQPAKLSKAQREALERVQQHGSIRSTTHNSEYAIHWKTTQTLMNQGWIEWTDHNCDYVRITPAGKAALGGQS